MKPEDVKDGYIFMLNGIPFSVKLNSPNYLRSHNKDKMIYFTKIKNWHFDLMENGVSIDYWSVGSIIKECEFVGTDTEIIKLLYT